MRDSQRSKLYKAERAISAWNRSSDFIMDRYSLNQYINSITQSLWFKQEFPKHNGIIILHLGQGMRHAHAYGKHCVAFPRWARFKLVILHEICHCVTPNDYASHGPEFARNFLKFVYKWMGISDELALRVSFKQHRVKYNIETTIVKKRNFNNPDPGRFLRIWREKQKMLKMAASPKTIQLNLFNEEQSNNNFIGENI